MSEIKTEGIILRITPYKDHERILHLLTPDHGMVSLLAKGVSKPKIQSLLSPLTQLEVIYRKKNSPLYFFKEGFAIEHHFFLRSRWELLEAGGKMASAILQSQLPEKASPALYRLLVACLKQLLHFEEPSTLITLFYLKLLTHEGVVAWDLPSLFPIPCSTAQWQALKELALTKSFSVHYQQKGFAENVLQLEKLLKILL